MLWHRPARTALGAAIALLAATLPACSIIAPKTNLALTAADAPATLTAGFTTAVFASSDPNEANLYLTDLPLARLADPGDSLADLGGSLLHIHVFVVPRAGSTPVDATACNAALRYAVLAQGAIGVYGGGGFLFPAGKTGAPSFGGSLAGGSLRLIRATSDFKDLLGPALLEGPVTTVRDAKTADLLRARLDALCRQAKPTSGGR